MLLLLAFISHDSYGQLITDSQRRLKTSKPSKSSSSGLFNRKKGRSSSGALRQSSPAKAPRSVSGSQFSSFRKRQVTTRSISGSGMRSGNPSVSPRYSAGSPFRDRQKRVTPRYSQGDHFQSTFFSRIFDKGNTPRYSVSPSFRESQKRMTPRYSQGGHFQPSFFSNIFDKGNAPRYSVSPSFRDSPKHVTPRYSAPRKKFHVDERSKKENAIYDIGTVEFQGSDRQKLQWKEKLDNLLESHATKNFKGSTKLKTYNPQANEGASEYSGNIKMKSLYQSRMHPSAKHLKANQSNDDIRTGLRKWNIFWTRLNRNKPQPDAVTDKVKKPKFDRKEADIWNE